MENQDTQNSDGKKYLFVVIFFLTLIGVGAYFVFKIPSTPTTDQLSQSLESSDNISASGSGETLGIETKNKMEDKLIIEDLVVGTGAEAVSDKKITVNYTGTLTNGTKFDSSLNPGRTPFTFTLGAGEVIQGWDQGFNGMKVGGKRKLTIPPSLGYGSNDMGSIPPNSTLIFEVELLGVE
jgi:FKBP-type peptidyl-prolyl cis-trans isomerase